MRPIECFCRTAHSLSFIGRRVVGVEGASSSSSCRVLTRRTSGIQTVMPNVRAKLPAEACSVRLVCDSAAGTAHQPYAACRSGSA